MDKKIFFAGIVFFFLFWAVIAAWAVASIKYPTLAFEGFSDGPAGYYGSNSGLAEVNFAFIGTKTGKNYITQGYGGTGFAFAEYRSHWHNGIDIAAKYGAPVHSASPGTVLATGNQDKYCYKQGFGKFVLVYDEAHGKVLMYAHLG